MAADYEIAILLSSQLQEGKADEAIERYQKVMTDHGAEVLKVDRWGVRKLAYEIRKQQQADYTFIRFSAEADAVSELDRLCKLDEQVLRHMVIRPDWPFEPEPEPEPEPEAEAAASGEAPEAEGQADGTEAEASEAASEETPEPEESEEKEDAQ